MSGASTDRTDSRREQRNCEPSLVMQSTQRCAKPALVAPWEGAWRSIDMHEFCARLLRFRGASTWLWAGLLLTAAGCKQDWSLPTPSQGPDGGPLTDAGALDA